MDAVEFFKEKERMCKKYVINGDACMYTNCPIARELHSCIDAEDTVEGVKKMVEIVENWSKTNPVIILTEQQKTAIRGRIAEGWNWVARDFSVRGEKYGYLRFYTHKPNINERGKEFLTKLDTKSENAISCLYKFVTFENSPLYLPDLLGGEE